MSGLVLLVLGVLPGCRDLVSPEVELVTPVQVGPVHVLGIEGEPLRHQQVFLDNFAWVSTPERETWSGSTDENGVCYPDLPPGDYGAEFHESYSGSPGWSLLRATLGTGVTEIDPRAGVFSGTVQLPPGFPVAGLQIELSASFPGGTRTVQRGATARVDAEGRFTTVLAGAGLFSARIRNGEAWNQVADSAPLVPHEPFGFAVNLIRQDLGFTVGGKLAPVTQVRISATSAADEGGFNDVFYLHDGGATIWAAPGPGTLLVEPTPSSPFVRRSFHHEFKAGETPVFELGEFLVTLYFVAQDSTPVYDCKLDLLSPGVTSPDRHSANGTACSVYLMSGQYRATVSGPNDLGSDFVFTVSGDTVLTVQLEPPF